jgi:hypothetical protein
MLTAIKFAKTFLLLALISVTSISLLAQDVDTVHVRPFQQYWTKPRLIPKVGFGSQDTGFGEIGVMLHQIYVHPLSLASMGPYMTVDGVFEPQEIIIGPKIGYEFTAGLLGLAADVTYYTDFDRESVLITPKAGLSLFGYANLFYGRNLKISDDHFKSISDNRVSLTFNMNRDYHNIHDAAKKRRKEKHKS